MSSTNNTNPPGLMLPTQKSYTPGAGNPRDSAMMSTQNMNNKQANLNASVSGGGRRRRFRGEQHHLHQQIQILHQHLFRYHKCKCNINLKEEMELILMIKLNLTHLLVCRVMLMLFTIIKQLMLHLPLKLAAQEEEKDNIKEDLQNIVGDVIVEEKEEHIVNLEKIIKKVLDVALVINIFIL